MKKIILAAIFLFDSRLILVANEETTYYVPQPLIAFGDTEGWTTKGKEHEGEMYMILGMPYFEKHPQGPVYHPIAMPHLMEGSDLRDCNLLSLSKIGITREDNSKIVYLDLSNVKVEKNSVFTLEVAAYAALECIRIVADRYEDEIILKIASPKNEEHRWREVEDTFNKHDKTKPFNRPENQDAKK